MTIDGAGYPHERDAALPQHLLDVARDEPEATVRTEVLEALVVRRPDLRPLARWMDERGALSATLITREREVEGVLVLPRGARRVPMSLEEVRAAKRLCDAFSGAAAAHAALERSLERERAATLRAGEAEARLWVREQVARKIEAHDSVVTAQLAESAHGGPYSPGARVAFEALERRVARGAPVLVVAPNGTDVAPYLARVHLAGPRSGMPFVVVDGASRLHHELARWLDPVASPLALAHRGLLLLEDGTRLPAEVQRLVGEAVAQRCVRWDGAAGGDGAPETDAIDVTLALTTQSAPRRIATGADDLDPALFAVLDDALADPIVWPHLRERGEDLRSMVLAGLAREGVCLRGAPLGIEDAAYERLADYPYPGEDAELRSILKRLALEAHGDVVRASDVAKLGLLDPPH
jgi:DNA-binding NtrC family response regulator